jgi:hypothetical protein
MDFAVFRGINLKKAISAKGIFLRKASIYFLGIGLKLGNNLRDFLRLGT